MQLFATKGDIQIHDDKNTRDFDDLNTKNDNLRSDLMKSINSIDRDLSKLTG
jgi:hypothetical protein